MSAVNFYLSKGFSPVTKSIYVNEGAAVLAWSPTTSTRIVLTGYTVASSIATSFILSFGLTGGRVIARGFTTASATVNSPDGFMDAEPAYDRAIYFTAKAGATDGGAVSLYGFELP